MVYRCHFETYEFKQGFDDKHWANKVLNTHITTPALCSCWMCGNPRKFYGNGKASLTLKEQKAKNDEIYQLKQLIV